MLKLRAFGLTMIEGIELKRRRQRKSGEEYLPTTALEVQASGFRVI